MFGRSSRALKENFQGLKKIKVCGMRFTIKRLNPLIDFPVDKIPQIFTDYVSRRKVDPNHVQTPAELLQMQKDIYSIIEAAVVEPPLVPIGSGEKRGKEDGITVEDLFRDAELGYKLYSEILNHSLFRFRGIKGLFFSTRARFLAFMQLRRSMGKLQST